MTERRYVYASSWSACTRQIALDLIFPNAKPPFPVDTLANFRRGSDRARDIKADITRAGRNCEPAFDVVGAEERFELRDKKGRVCIVGKVDFRLKFDGVKGSAPVEVKSWHPNLIQKVSTFDDLFRNRFTRKGAFQLLAYMLATNEPVGFMLLDRNGIPLILEVRLYDYLDKIENFLQRAEVAMDARERYFESVSAMGLKQSAEVPESILPPFIDEPLECRMCAFFGSHCNPPLSFPGAAIVVDEETIMKTERYATLDKMPEIAEYEGLDKWFKKRFRGVEKAVVGKAIVEGKWQKNSTYELTDEIEAKINELKAPYKVTTDKGKFFLDVSITE